jgi:hypothetical protein
MPVESLLGAATDSAYKAIAHHEGLPLRDAATSAESMVDDSCVSAIRSQRLVPGCSDPTNP